MLCRGFSTFARVAKKSQILPEIAIRDDRVPLSRQRAWTRNPRRRKFGVDAWNAMVQKKIRRDLIRGRSSVPSSLKCFARGCSRLHFCSPTVHVYVYVFLSRVRFFCWFFSNYVEDYCTRTVQLPAAAEYV